ncbi:MAG: PAS domain-containing protein [Desulfobacterales bacterium]|nr:PAS domain-containing protein [Desulfobacterales bacterium]
MKNMLQTTFDVSFDGIMITEAGPGYPIIYVNPAFCNMTGYRVEELLGKSPELLQGDKSDQDVLAELKEKIERGHTFHGKTINYRKDGAEFIMEWKIVPIRNAENAISHYLAIQRQIQDDELAYKPHESQIPFSQK